MAQPDKYSAGLGVILLVVGAGECSLCVTAVPGGMDPGWPAGWDAPGPSLRSPRPGRHAVVPGYLPAECAPGPLPGSVSAPRTAPPRGPMCPLSVTRPSA